LQRAAFRHQLATKAEERARRHRRRPLFDGPPPRPARAGPPPPPRPVGGDPGAGVVELELEVAVVLRRGPAGRVRDRGEVLQLPRQLRDVAGPLDHRELLGDDGADLVAVDVAEAGEVGDGPPDPLGLGPAGLALVQRACAGVGEQLVGLAAGIADEVLRLTVGLGQRLLGSGAGLADQVRGPALGVVDGGARLLEGVFHLGAGLGDGLVGLGAGLRDGLVGGALRHDEGALEQPLGLEGLPGTHLDVGGAALGRRDPRSGVAFGRLDPSRERVALPDQVLDDLGDAVEELVDLVAVIAPELLGEDLAFDVVWRQRHVSSLLDRRGRLQAAAAAQQPPEDADREEQHERRQVEGAHPGRSSGSVSARTPCASGRSGSGIDGTHDRMMRTSRMTK
jgi:hypothetical protein